MSVQLHKAIDILELIEASERPLALGAIADRVAMGKPAAHRLLQVLVARGYVEQEPETQNYLATLAWRSSVSAISPRPACAR